MPWAPAEKNASCAECLDIGRELADAYAEAYERNRPSAEALGRLIGGTEEDAARADDLLNAFRYGPVSEMTERSNALLSVYGCHSGRGLPLPLPRLQAAMRRSDEHLARTGHRSWFKRPPDSLR